MATAMRQQLLDAAVELMIEEGSAGITTGRLTRQAGVVQSAFYNHFSSVEDCRRAALDAVREQVLGTADIIFDEIRGPKLQSGGDFEALVFSILSRAEDRQHTFRLLTNRSPEPEVAAVVEDVIQRLETALSESIVHQNSRLRHLDKRHAQYLSSFIIRTFLTSLDLVLRGADPHELAGVTTSFMAGGVFAAAGLELEPAEPINPAVG